MNIYTMKTIEEASVHEIAVSTTTFSVPVDSLGNIPEYLNKDRIIKDGQMLVFDTRQEYLDYLSANGYR